MTQKVWTRKEIDSILRSNDRAVEVGILRLAALQTHNERTSLNTSADNSLGFNKAHAAAGTRFAEWLSGIDRNGVKRWAPKSLNHPSAAKVFARYCKNYSSPMDRARAIALLHSRQLTAIANGEIKL